ncbi:MAG: recombinase family protein [Muricoprocola sp.]
MKAKYAPVSELKEEMELKVAAYARVSTDRENQINSLENQKQYFADYIRKHDGWKLVKIYYDEGISGTQTKKRTGFNQMMKDSMDGKIDLILTKEVSRFARNTVDTLSYTRKLNEHGVGVKFINDNIDSRDKDGELRLTIMSSIAQEESRKTSERVRWGQTRQMEKGIVFGRDLLGYYVREGKLYINEEEAGIVRAIFHKYTNEGKGCVVIARELTEEGMRPKRIDNWSHTVVLRVLKNEKYVGDLCQKKTITPNYLTHEKKYNEGEEEKIYIKNHHEPIIDRNLWERTQKELQRRSRTLEQKSRYSNRYWCSGKIRCAECGSLYVCRRKNLKNGKLYKAWRCPKTEKQPGCSNTSINEKSLQACMKECINTLVPNRTPIKNEIISELRFGMNQSSPETDLPKIRRKIKALEEKRKRAIDLMLEGLISENDLKVQTKWYQEEIQRLYDKIKEAEELKKQSEKMEHDMEPYLRILEKIMEKESDTETVFHEILDEINIHPGNILDIWLKDVPVGIRFKIKTMGKNEDYKTEILEKTFIHK